MGEFKVVSLNVRGVRGDKRYSIFRWLKDKKYDICLLQETYCIDNFVSKFNRGWSGEIIHSTSNSVHSRDVCVMFRRDLNYKVIDIHRCDSGRMLLINLDINGDTYTIVNVYSPNDLKQRIAFIENLGKCIDQKALNVKNLLIGGDFNCVNSEIDRTNKRTDKSTGTLTEFKSKYDLIDVWRKLHPDQRSFTFIDPSDRGYSSRIDFFLCSSDVTLHAQGSNISCAPTPDHKAVDLELQLTNCKKGKGYWKMNVSVLEDDKYLEGAKSLILSTIEEYSGHVDKISLWEFLKMRIKNYTIQFCVAKARNKKDEIQELEAQINYIDSALADTGTKQSNAEQLKLQREECKLLLDTLYEKRSKGCQIRSRAAWIELGERSTGYLLGLEKSRQGNNVTQSLKAENGEIQLGQKEILEVAKTYYTNLYRSKASHDAEVDRYIESIDMEKSLSDLDQLGCEGGVSFNECELAVKNMKKKISLQG